MTIAHDPRDGWRSITTDPEWPTRGAPDAISAGQAARVQELAARAVYLEGEDPVIYIMETYGDTREQAEIIVKNCRRIEE